MLFKLDKEYANFFYTMKQQQNQRLRNWNLFHSLNGKNEVECWKSLVSLLFKILYIFSILVSLLNNTII